MMKKISADIGNISITTRSNTSSLQRRGNGLIPAFIVTSGRGCIRLIGVVVYRICLRLGRNELSSDYAALIRSYRPGRVGHTALNSLIALTQMVEQGHAINPCESLARRFERQLLQTEVTDGGGVVEIFDYR